MSYMSRKRKSVVDTVLCLVHREYAEHFLLLLGICLSSQIISTVFAYIVQGMLFAVFRLMIIVFSWQNGHDPY